MTELPFAFEPGEWLEHEPRSRFEEGAVFGVASDAHDPRVAPLLTVAWLEEPDGVTLEAVVEEDVARLLSGPGDLLLDHEWVHDGDVEAVRTYSFQSVPAACRRPPSSGGCSPAAGAGRCRRRRRSPTSRSGGRAWPQSPRASA